jgi:hypothetical protein
MKESWARRPRNKVLQCLWRALEQGEKLFAEAAQRYGAVADGVFDAVAEFGEGAVVAAP